MHRHEPSVKPGVPAEGPATQISIGKHTCTHCQRHSGLSKIEAGNEMEYADFQLEQGWKGRALRISAREEGWLLSPSTAGLPCCTGRERAPTAFPDAARAR